LLVDPLQISFLVDIQNISDLQKFLTVLFHGVLLVLMFLICI
jgi:hypothetical protein